ncbi:MAG: CapA family protein [Candidatus Hydrothermales bacterium]
MITDTLILTFCFMGDVLPGDFLKNRVPPDSGFYLFKDVYNFLEYSDLSFANFEGTFNLDVKERRKDYKFLVPLSVIPGLKKSKIKAFSIANNHIYDGGESSAKKTYEILKKEGFLVSGLKGSFDTITIKGIKVGFVAFSVYDYTNSIFNKDDLSLIGDISKNVNILVVSFHAGTEGDSAIHVKDKFEYFYGEKRGNVKEFARFAIDNGADVVYGHGPHVIRGLEIYKDRIVSYSLGNFAAYGGFNLKYPRNISFILKVKLNGNGEFLEGEIIPIILQAPGIPKYDHSKEAVFLLKRLIEEDKLEGVKIEGEKILRVNYK